VQSLCPQCAAVFAQFNEVFQVSKQVMPGTYSSNDSGSCHCARLMGFSGVVDDIVENDLAQGPQVFAIEDGDVGFKTSRCGTWTKIE